MKKNAITCLLVLGCLVTNSLFASDLIQMLKQDKIYAIGEISSHVRQTDNINMKDEDGKTPLIHAIKNNQKIWTIRELLDAGACVKLSDNDGWTPLMWAASRNNHFAVFKTLVRAGADIEAKSNKGARAL